MIFRKRNTVILDRRALAQGEVLIEEGEFGAQAYLIQSGMVRVYTSHNGREVELARLGVGQIVGEMALISDGPRTASVQAVEDCNLIIIARPQFVEKLAKSDATLRAIVHMMAKRLIEGNKSLIGKKTDVKDLKESVHAIYENILAAMPASRQKVFQNAVLPPLDDFLQALESFQERYGDES